VGQPVGVRVSPFAPAWAHKMKSVHAMALDEPKAP